MGERDQKRDVVPLHRDSPEYTELVRSALHESYKFLRDVLLHRVRLSDFERDTDRISRGLYQRSLVGRPTDD